MLCRLFIIFVDQQSDSLFQTNDSTKCSYFRQISEILQTTSLSSIWSFLSNPAFGQLMMFRIALVATGFFVGFPLLALKGPLGAELIAG